MSFETVPILLVLSVLLTAGLAFIVDGVRRLLRDRER
jgi:hypothetical protein